MKLTPPPLVTQEKLKKIMRIACRRGNGEIVLYKTRAVRVCEAHPVEKEHVHTTP